MPTRDTAELARTTAPAAQAPSLDRCNLMGTSFGCKAALWLGLQKPERGLGAGAGTTGGDPPPGGGTPVGTPEEIARRLFAHRERQPPLPTLDPRQAAKQAAFVWRVFGPPRPRP